MDQQKDIKLEIVPQPKQECQTEQQIRNWLDLPPDLTANILHRIGVVDILESAQKVCTAWRKIYKDPAMWRVVYMDASSDLNANQPDEVMCKHVVDLSQGQLVDITIGEYGYDYVLLYIADRCSQLKRLTIAHCDEYLDKTWKDSLKKFPLLEELGLYATTISKEGIEFAGRYCSMLKTLKVNRGDSMAWFEDCSIWDEDSGREIIITADKDYYIDDEIAMAIGQNLHELRHLELIGNTMSNEGLEMILDGCHHLESLDLRGCLCIDLNGDLGKRCSQQIKFLRLPNDSLEGCPFIYKNDVMSCDVDDES